MIDLKDMGIYIAFLRDKRVVILKDNEDLLMYMADIIHYTTVDNVPELFNLEEHI